MNEGNEMSTAMATVEQVLIQGDLSKLNTAERVSYYKAVCESVGLNPLTKPFDYLKLSGREVLYAKRDATDQLRKIHGVSVRITNRDNIDGVYVVTASATDKTGRVDESTGAVNLNGLKGDHLANALMKAETKAKRRVTLSICGLGLLDETEIETIPGATVHVERNDPLHAAPAIEAAVNGAVKRHESNNGIPADRDGIEQQVFDCMADMASMRGKSFDDAYWAVMRGMKIDYASLADIPYGILCRVRDEVAGKVESMRKELIPAG